MHHLLHGVKAVLFDLDGTLLDSAPDLAAAANMLRAQQSLPDLPLADYRPYVGTGARGMLRIALGLTPDMAEFDVQKEAFFLAYEAQLMRQSSLFPGVPGLLKQFDERNLGWGIVTNKSQRFTHPIVQQEATLGRAAVVVCGDTTAHAKPHPAPLLHACAQLQVDPAQVIYVGDDERDMQAARAAGMRGIAADYGYLGGVDSTQPWNPTASIKSPHELLNLLGLD